MKPGSRASPAVKIACSACPGPLPDHPCARYRWPSRHGGIAPRLTWQEG
jgi:hypothetical protein